MDASRKRMAVKPLLILFLDCWWRNCRKKLEEHRVICIPIYL